MIPNTSPIQLINVAKGHVLFRQGDPGDAAYLVAAGSVGIFREQDGHKVMLATLRPGELFGEMAVIDNSPRMATAFAISDCTLSVISGAQIRNKLGRSDPFVRSLVHMLMNNLRNVHQSYTPRSRSLHDAVATIAAQTEVLENFIGAKGSFWFRMALTPHVKVLAATMREIKRIVLANRKEDQRDDAMLHEERVERPDTVAEAVPA